VIEAIATILHSSVATVLSQVNNFITVLLDYYTGCIQK